MVLEPLPVVSPRQPQLAWRCPQGGSHYHACSARGAPALHPHHSTATQGRKALANVCGVYHPVHDLTQFVLICVLQDQPPFSSCLPGPHPTSLLLPETSAFSLLPLLSDFPVSSVPGQTVCAMRTGHFHSIPVSNINFELIWVGVCE